MTRPPRRAASRPERPLRRRSSLLPALLAPLLALPLLALLPACADQPPADPLAALGPPPELPAPRQPRLTEDQARAAFACLRQRSRMEYDPEALVVLHPNRTWTVPWEEHPAGEFSMATDGRGLREAPRPPGTPLPPLRVLALGDSHTDATVANDEAWPNALEALLRADGLDVEVFNAGVGTTGPPAYLGMLRRQAVLRPQVVVVALFLGNDLLNSLTVHDVRSGRSLQHRGRAYREPLKRAMTTWGQVVAQGFNQAYLFSKQPREAALAVRETVEVLDEMDAVCQALGAELLVALLPTKLNVEPDDDPERVAGLSRILRLEPGDLDLNDRTGDRLIEALEPRGLRLLDPRPALRADPRRLYWLEDHHLNVDGHQLFAEQLHPVVADLLRDG